MRKRENIGAMRKRETPSAGRRLFLSLTGALGIMLGITIPFWCSGLDISVQSLFFAGGTWPLDAHPVVQLLYRYGSLPGLLLAVGAVVLLVRGGNSARSFEWRRAGAALLLTLVIGPGLMVNAISKKYSGRPRPREISIYGGSWEFRQVFEFGTPGRGQSFPAGHPSMGFLFFSLYFSFRRKRPGIARTALVGGGIYGGLVGVGRIVQGAHFLSDVLWSGGMVWMAARVAHFLTGDEEGENSPRSWWGRRRSSLASITMGIGMIAVLAAAFLLGAPYYFETHYSWNPEARPAVIVLDLERARVRIRSGGGEPGLHFTARGFSPKSSSYEGEFFGGPDGLVLRSRKSGFFAELTGDVELILPPVGIDSLVIRCGRGEIDFAATSPIKRVLLETKRGRISWRGDCPVEKAMLRNGHGDIRFAGLMVPKHLMLMAPEGEADLARVSFSGGIWIPHGSGDNPTNKFLMDSTSRQAYVKARTIISPRPES